MVKHCSKMVKEFCSVIYQVVFDFENWINLPDLLDFLYAKLIFSKDLLKTNDADGVLPCLYKNKYDHKMDPKCRAELDHRELVRRKM